MLIRRETPADVPAARAVIAAAFAEPGAPGAPDPVEATLLDALRTCEGWLPELSVVAVAVAGDESEDEVVGHVVCTRGHVDGVPALGLGPIGVRPDTQRRGVGHALMHAVLGAADALGEPLVALLGSPAYYGRFGFRPATELGIRPPDPAWGEYFQVRTLTAYEPGLRGTFGYAAPFDDV
ncbi:N-acetyltransferase [Streptomyces sp. LRE541]|uniref:GNAT family N-acetyltransferase n=1 Tax=Streptomyces sp. LRE541 TaxID=2931983 RepID=UPI00200D3BFA|nr:N-acetyltransferase [Streptomyces sp. LRE541]UPZ30343.1 N-acetyltransferase [Streptomyces sp. LRE541]